MSKIPELLGLSALSLSTSFVLSNYLFGHPISGKAWAVAIGVSFTSILIYTYIKNDKDSDEDKKKQIALPDTYSTYGRLKEILSGQGYDLKIKK